LFNKKTPTTYVRNLGTGLGQAQKCGSVKPLNGISTLPFFIIGTLLAIKVK